MHGYSPNSALCSLHRAFLQVTHTKVAGSAHTGQCAMTYEPYPRGFFSVKTHLLRAHGAILEHPRAALRRQDRLPLILIVPAIANKFSGSQAEHHEVIAGSLVEAHQGIAIRQIRAANDERHGMIPLESASMRCQHPEQATS